MNIKGVYMGKFPEADKEFLSVKICLRCKARNPITAKKCRKCNSTYFRMKKKKVNK